VEIQLHVVQYSTEIKLVITNCTPASRSCDFVITRLISLQIALHSIQLPLFIIFILKSMVFPAIWLVHRSAISARIALLAVRFVLKSHLLSTNHIRVLTSANQSYLIIGFKQPMNLKKNVIHMANEQKQKMYMSWFNTLDSLKTRKYGYSYSKLSKNCKEFYFFVKFHK
jgi:hypothetical protein